MHACAPTAHLPTAQAAEEAARQEEAEAAAAEEARLARLRAEYEAAVPEEIRERVAAAVERELVGVAGCPCF